MTAVDFLWAIPVFGILIVIHELGHFSVAKYFGVKVHEFAVGIGPRLAGFTRGETKYNLRLIPFGGYVRMAGMEEEEGEPEEERGFNAKSWPVRFAIIAAGPIMNFVLASVLYSGFLFFVGTDRMDIPVIGEVPVNCASVTEPNAAPQPCPAAVAGLQVGDRVISINNQPVSNWQDILDLVSTSDGQMLDFVIQRGEQSQTVRMEPIRMDGRWVVGIRWETQRAPLGTALIQGPVMTGKALGAMVVALADMVTGRTPAELTGPVGITRTIAQSAASGMDSLLMLTAFLSINLGLFNLLPIPALDGSRLFFILLEGLRGRRVDPQRENMVHFVGFLLLIGLMLVVTYSDIVNR